VDISRARLAAREYRMLYRQSVRTDVPADRVNAIRDAMSETVDKMATEIECLPPGASIIEPCHDDSEECVHCAFPEHAAVVILLDGKPVCREHIWRALSGTLGVRDRHI
jgi:hypothetical protein